jgi:hypothetical protein
MESELIKSLEYDTKYTATIDEQNINFTIIEDINALKKGVYVKPDVKGINNDKIVLCYSVVEELKYCGIGQTGEFPDRPHLADYFGHIRYIKQRTQKQSTKKEVLERYNVTYLVEVHLPSYYKNPWCLWRRIGRSGRWCKEFWSTIRKKEIDNPILTEPILPGKILVHEFF